MVNLCSVLNEKNHIFCSISTVVDGTNYLKCMNPSNEFFLIEHRLRKIFIGDVAKQTTLDKKDDSMFVK